MEAAADNTRLKVNVGGRVFETTLSTLLAGGEESFLAIRAKTAVVSGIPEIFFDDDPDVFAVLLSALRSNGLYVPADRRRKLELIQAAQYYGVTDYIRGVMHPMDFSGIDIERVGSLVVNGRDFPSAIAAAEDGSLCVAHGSKITPFNWALEKGNTTLTEFSCIQSLCRISESCVAAGSTYLPGLHFYNFEGSFHVKSLTWFDADDPRIYSPTVHAIACSEESVFASFLSGHKMDNTILIVDRSRLEIVKELARQSGTSAGYSKHATKLQWLPGMQLLAAAGVHGGAFGYSSYIRLYDSRTHRAVLEWAEPNVRNPRAVQRDSFADVTVSEELGGIVKVSVVTGAVAMTDLRKISEGNLDWITLVERNPDLEMTSEGPENKLLCYGREIFCSRGADVEVWSEMKVEKEVKDEWFMENSFRRNFIEQSRRSSSGYKVKEMDAGGSRLFIARDDLQSVEIWESKFF